MQAEDPEIDKRLELMVYMLLLRINSTSYLVKPPVEHIIMHVRTDVYEYYCFIMGLRIMTQLFHM